MYDWEDKKVVTIPIDVFEAFFKRKTTVDIGIPNAFKPERIYFHTGLIIKVDKEQGAIVLQGSDRVSVLEINDILTVRISSNMRKNGGR